MRFPYQISIHDQIVLGIAHIPYATNDEANIVIMCYGLNGHRVEQHRLSVELGDCLAEHGFLFLRTDYRNLGLSDGTFENSTLKQRSEDIIEIINYFESCCFPTPLNVTLIGFSDGGKTIVDIASKISCVKQLIYLNPILALPVNNNNRTTSITNPVRFQLHPKFSKPMRPFYGTWLNLEILRELNTDNTYNRISSLTQKQYFIFGTNDKYTREIRCAIENMRNNNIKIAYVQDAGHVFSEPGAHQKILDLITNFLISGGGTLCNE